MKLNDLGVVDFRRKNKLGGKERLGVPGVSILGDSGSNRACFNKHAVKIIKKNGYKYCLTGRAETGHTVFLFSKSTSEGCYTITFPKSGGKAWVCTGEDGLKKHAAVPVEIDGDYFIAKFD